jgi:hypothetical protein
MEWRDSINCSLSYKSIAGLEQMTNNRA